MIIGKIRTFCFYYKEWGGRGWEDLRPHNWVLGNHVLKSPWSLIEWLQWRIQLEIPDLTNVDSWNGKLKYCGKQRKRRRSRLGPGASMFMDGGQVVSVPLCPRGDVLPPHPPPQRQHPPATYLDPGGGTKELSGHFCPSFESLQLRF